MPALTKRGLDAAQPKDAEFFIWCDATPGFGCRVYPSGKKVFISQVRVGRATRRIKIGPYGAFTVEQARERAREIARAVADGRDPQKEKQERRESLTVSEVCDAYLEAARAGLVMTRFRKPKRPRTIYDDEGRVARHIKPLIGSHKARDLTRSDIQRMADAIAQGKTAGTFTTKPRGKAVVTGGAIAAARAVELFGGVWGWAEKRGLVVGPSPTRGVETIKAAPKDRILDDKELAALGKVLRKNEEASPLPVAALRLIALTGLRREEACALRWQEIDQAGRCLRLERTKTGSSTRPLAAAALEVLRALPRLSDEWVFPNRDNTGSADYKKALAALFDAAGLSDARSHDLRRTFGTVAANEGYSDATIAELLGHARRGVTARHYIRRPDAALVAAADRVASHIAKAMEGRSATAEIVNVFAERARHTASAGRA